MRYLNPAALALFLAAAAARPAAAQTPRPDSPAWVVQRFFVDKDFPQQRDYITGEMLSDTAYHGRTVGAIIPRGFHVSYRQLEAGPTRAMFAVLVTNGKQSTDSYAFLVKDGPRWQISAVRALTLPPGFLTAVQRLASTPSLPDSLQRTLVNMRLVSSSDATLKEYFHRNRQSLVTLVRQFSATRIPGIAVTPSGEPVVPSTAGLLTQYLASLHVTAVFRDDRMPGCTMVSIGGIGSHSVGFLNAGDGCTVPPMSPDRFIYVERLAPGWYVYKTT